ncbi:N-6 DNA methylase [Demequina sp. SYSU T00039]|uniref:N-6 DNA methylase n=1 Tax=Demequina lignilytica TaxID=3051663 RepID=A0AAW7M9J2_9MICO|nr:MULTISPECIES: N-6 DNA methylase [unclassified Demequina]MDN4478637.1 N-6 DNA methylase [Demequina sp. SYSU T00039-1]MDN4488615.1 N-6 DNA methylase [Demequina sp. SYSU T00039]
MKENTMEGLVSPSDIAELTGYTRGAVSNWRRRSEDFPEAVAGTAANPLFRRADIMEWLSVTGKRIKKDRGENAVFAAMNTMRGSLEMSELTMLVVTVACARKLAAAQGREGFVGRWRDASAKFSHNGTAHVVLGAAFRDLDPRCEVIDIDHRIIDLPAHRMDRVVDAFASIEVSDLADVIDAILERVARSQGKMGAEHGFVASRTASLLASLCAGSDGGTLYDPACGIGVTLLQAVDAGIKPSRVVGHDINDGTLRVARQRAFLRDVTIELSLGDVLEHDLSPELKADVIVAEPPFGLSFRAAGALFDPRYVFGQPPKSSGDWAWVQHAVEHLDEGGRAYVILTAGALDRANERSIRMGLVGAGCVEAVVGLPGKMLPHVSVPLALLVLRRPVATDVDTDVLFIDASEAAEPESAAARWLKGPGHRDDVPHTTARIADVLARDARLEPRAWFPNVGPDARDVASSYADGWKQVVRAAEELDGLASIGPASLSSANPRVATVNDLVTQGILKVWGGGRAAEKYADMGYPQWLLERLVSAADVRDGTLSTAPVVDELDDAPGRPHLTDAGDLLVTTWNEVRAHVDTVGKHLPGSGVQRVKVKDPSALDPEYLALALAGRWNEWLIGGSTIQRAKLGDLEVPLVPLAEQRHVVTSLRGFQDIAQLAARLLEGAASVRTAYFDALRYGIELSGIDAHGSSGPSSRTGDS